MSPSSGGGESTALDSLGASVPGTVPDAFRAVVERHGERRALEADGATLTYAELDRLSNRVAHGLLERGGDEPVLMVAPLEPTPLVVMLGALKAGRVFVPLDPRDPPERVRLVREQLGALMVSADPLDEISAGRDDDPALSLDPYRRSLVYFTSGSTGRPKGTVKSHKELTLAPIAYGITPHDRVAIVLPLAFAMSITPVFGALLAGATGCLFDPITHSIGSLAEWMNQAGVTVLKATPSVLRATATALEERSRRVVSVRLAITGGERCDGDHLEVVRRVLPRAAIANMYASTEAGYVAVTMIEPGEPLDSGPIPFRRVFPWQTVEIVDGSGRPVPPGEAGEIVVRGTEVSLGYWEEPDGAEQRFVSESDGARSIRTGDRGRLRRDGTLEHLGRTDLRVKVRGQMVDPQAVEHVLSALPDIREAVVSPVLGREGDTRLIAHVLPERDANLSARDLRVALAERLPSFMIPSTFVWVDVIPRNQRGKVDREALRQAAPGVAPSAVQHVPPRNQREHALAEVVAEVLGVESVGAHDDVFELGADSLSAIELLAAIGDRLGVELTPGDLLEAPTIEALALRTGLGAASGARTVLPLHLGGAGTPFFCVPGGGGTILQLRRLARRVGRPTYSFRPRGFDRRALPDRSVERAAARYLSALRTVQPSGPYLIGGYSFGGLVAYEMARQLRSAGETVALLALLDPASKEPTYLGRLQRIVAGGPTGRVASTWRVARHAGRWVRHSIELGTAGIVTRSPANQTRAFFLLSARMGRRYRPRPYDGPSLLLRTSGWERVDDLDMTHLLTGERRLAVIPGDHLTMLREPHVASLATVLREALVAADRSPHASRA